MENALNKSLSDTEIHNLGLNNTPPNFVSTRSKRKRDDEISSELSTFKEEIKNMITSLLSSQNQDFKKNIAILKEIQTTNKNIESSIAFLSAQNEEFQNKICSLENQIKEDRKYITILEDRIEEMQRENRKSNFEIKNVPKQTNETKEDLINIVASLSDTIHCNLNTSDICDIYRVRTKKENAQNTPIIVETSSALLRNKVIKLCKTFNSNHQNKLCAKHLGLRSSLDTPIFVSEQLTAKGSRLYFLARDLVKCKSYKYCWTAYGKVYVRKGDSSPIILIKNEAQIHKLLQGI